MRKTRSSQQRFRSAKKTFLIVGDGTTEKNYFDGVRYCDPVDSFWEDRVRSYFDKNTF